MNSSDFKSVKLLHFLSTLQYIYIYLCEWGQSPLNICNMMYYSALFNFTFEISCFKVVVYVWVLVLWINT